MKHPTNVANPFHELNLRAKAEYDLWRAEAALADAMQTTADGSEPKRLISVARESVRTALRRMER